MSLEKILQEFEKLKGQLVIVDYNRIARLIAIGDDEEDYYYVTWDGRTAALKWSSCVGPLMPLKGHLRKKDYDELVRISKLNHWDYLPKDEIEIKQIRKDMLFYSNGNMLLTKPYWEIN